MNRQHLVAYGVGAIAVGLACLLSPLTVWFVAVMFVVVACSVRGLSEGERQFVTAIVVAAVALRVVAIAALFLVTDHARVPFGSFFGDEAYFIKRSLWLRNIALGVPVHPLDLEYAFEPNGRSSLIYVFAFVQAMVGPAPYGIRLLSVASYVSAALLLYRNVRTTLGRVPAAFGLVVLLFLPTLFVWSISALKEPVFMLVGALGLACAIRIARSQSWRGRALFIVGAIVVAATLQTIREGGALFIAVGTAAGLAIGFIATRPRAMLATLVILPVLVGAVFRSPQVQLKTYAAIQSEARQHWGAVTVSRGYGYKLLDERFYPDLLEISSLNFPETMRFLIRGVAAYVMVPLPWDARSRAAAAYVPEQVIWYLLAALAAVGALFGFRRDATVTGLLMAFAALLAAGAALTDGNVGTLVRHRGLALPYVVWLSGVGASEVLMWLTPLAPPADTVPVDRLHPTSAGFA